MNLRRPPKPIVLSEAIEADIARIEDIWRDCRKAYGKDGPFLFGSFCIADAMFAPVVTAFTLMPSLLPRTAGPTWRHCWQRRIEKWKSAALKEILILPHDKVD